MTGEKKSVDEAIDLQAIESHAVGEMTPSAELRRDLRPHQVFMFSIACAIGTGLVIGSGTALSRGGPASMLIAYLLIGAVVFFVMTALGEMASFAPMKKGFGGYATRMVDPAFGYSGPSKNVVLFIPLLISSFQVCNRLELLLQVCHCDSHQLDCRGPCGQVLGAGFECCHLDHGLRFHRHCYQRKSTPRSPSASKDHQPDLISIFSSCT
jgi:hypothetical protein